MVRAPRRRLGGGVRARARRAGHPCRARRRRRALPERGRRTTSRSRCSSPRPGCCAPSGRCARWRPGPPRTARASCAGARAPGRRRRRCSDDGTRLEGDAVVWACGAVAGATSSPRCAAAGDPPGGAVLRLRARVGRPARLGGLRRAMYGTADVDGLGFKASLDLEGAPVEADAELPEARRHRAGGAGLSRGPLPSAGARSAVRRPLLSLRADARHRASSRRRYPARSVSGWSAAARATVSSTARRWPSWWPQALRDGEPLPARFGLGRARARPAQRLRTGPAARPRRRRARRRSPARRRPACATPRARCRRRPCSRRRGSRRRPSCASGGSRR